MTLKCVRYLAQQGYGTGQVVVLTPYLAQLRLLFEVLGKENDPVLNDLDSYDLVRAGLMPAATAQVQKRRLRISTIGKIISFLPSGLGIAIPRTFSRRFIVRGHLEGVRGTWPGPRGRASRSGFGGGMEAFSGPRYPHP